jgi:hypothetical protein
MNVDELTEQLRQLKSVTALPAARCFIERVPFRPTIHFFRPFAEDVVICASIQHLEEERAVALGVNVLDTLAARWTEVADREVVKLAPWTGGPPFADELLVLGRGVARWSAPKGYFLPSRTVAAFPINHIEFTGEETAAEATERMRYAALNDMTRTPSPIVFTRFRLSDGSGSTKFFSVSRSDSALSILNEVVNVGGRFEFENYERERCLLTTEAGTSVLEMRVGGVTRAVSHQQAITHFHTMTLQGVAALMKELG